MERTKAEMREMATPLLGKKEECQIESLERKHHLAQKGLDWRPPSLIWEEQGDSKVHSRDVSIH